MFNMICSKNIFDLKITHKRLYTEDHFENKMPEVTKPEIERSPLAHVIMQLLAARVRNVRKFEFMDRPPEDAIKTALNELKILGVSKDIGQNELELTDLGHKIGLDGQFYQPVVGRPWSARNPEGPII